MDGLARIGNGQFVAAQQRSSSDTGLPDKTEDFGALVTDEPAPEATRRPNMIQFMAATGASAKEARDALYVHKNWQHYLPPRLGWRSRYVSGATTGPARTRGWDARHGPEMVCASA